MNIIKEDNERTGHERIKSIVAKIAVKAGMPEEKADFLARLLVSNDLRGVFSHGSKQIAAYAKIMQDGSINPDPHIKIVKSDESTVVIDGDGGLGYFPAIRGVEEIVQKCRKNGVAAAVTFNHGHIGAAGIYSRKLADNDLIGYVTSGHQLNLDPNDSIMRAAGGSPMSFAVPCGIEPPMVLDFGTMHDLYKGSPHVDELFNLAPGLVFRSMGLGFMCQALGGFLAGIPFNEINADRTYKGASQGSLIIALDIARFIPVDCFKGEMDEFIKAAGRMKPMPGYDRATLPGILEAEHFKEWSIKGIPYSPEIKDLLIKTAFEYGIHTSI